MASPLRKLTRDDVVFEVRAEEDDLPIVGNAQVSDDPAADRALELELLLRRSKGDVWAWALVRVVATWKSFRGVAVLGGCSYPSRAAFLEDAYYDDLKVQALDDLQARVQLTYDNLEELVVRERVLPTRMWINQPSTLQSLHDLHGANVLSIPERDDVYRVYLLAGPIISQEASARCLSKGWNYNPAELVVDESAVPQEEVAAPQVSIDKVYAFILIYRGWVMLEPFTDAETAMVKAALYDDDKALYMLARLLGVEDEMRDNTRKFDTLRVRDTLMVAYGRMSADEQERVKHLVEERQLHEG